MAPIRSENKYSKVHLAYGRDGFDLNIPENFDVIEPKFVKEISNTKKAINEALISPINSKPLREMLFNKGKAPKAEGLYGYNWFNTPNRRFPTILDFQEFCKEKSIKIIDNHFLNTEEKKLVSDDPNLNCDTAIFVLSKI